MLSGNPIHRCEPTTTTATDHGREDGRWSWRGGRLRPAWEWAWQRQWLLVAAGAEVALAGSGARKGAGLLGETTHSA